MNSIYQASKAHLLIILVTLLYFFINYLFIDKKKILFLATFFYIFIVLIYLYNKYKKDFFLILDNIKLEIKSISWPSKSDVKQTSLMVIAFVFFSSLILWIIDSFLTYIISKIM